MTATVKNGNIMAYSNPFHLVVSSLSPEELYLNRNLGMLINMFLLTNKNIYLGLSILLLQ